MNNILISQKPHLNQFKSSIACCPKSVNSLKMIQMALITSVVIHP